MDEVYKLKQMARFYQQLHVSKEDARMGYDAMSDSLIWTDEIPQSRPNGWTVIRYILATRADLAMGAEPRYPELWDLGQQLFPEWVGFLKTRTEWSQDYIDLYQSSRSRFSKQLGTKKFD